MNWSQILLMRHELLLILISMIVLIGELALEENRKTRIIPLVIGLFSLVTIIGFFPLAEGRLFGGMYITDPLRVIMKNVLNIGSLLIVIQSASWLREEKENAGKISEFYFLIFSSLIGLSYLISSGSFLMFYLALELGTVPLAGLAAYEKLKNKSAEAGIKFILSAAFSSGILLFGISLIYGSLGTTYFHQIPELFSGDALQLLGFIFFFAGLSFKISLVPFHLWTADVYEGSPTNITSYLSVISKGASVFILIITLFTIFPIIVKTWTTMIYGIAILTMTVGNLFAIRQDNLKRFLAFSSIAQAGFILLGVIGGTQLGMASVIYFVLVYIFSNLAAFGVVIAVSIASGKENISDYSGLYKSNPKLSLVMMLALFSLAGIPPLAGFFGKFFLFTAAAQQGYYTLVLIAVLNAIISLYYYLLVIKAMFIKENDAPIAFFNSDMPTKVGLIICVAGIIITGFTSFVFDYINQLSFGILEISK